MQAKSPRGKLRILLRRLVQVATWAAVLVTVLVVFWLRGALYDRFVRFPRVEAAWQAIRAERQSVTNHAGWNEYRGILHSHSEYSHDCEVPFEEILRVITAAGFVAA